MLGETASDSQTFRHRWNRLFQSNLGSLAVSLPLLLQVDFDRVFDDDRRILPRFDRGRRITGLNRSPHEVTGAGSPRTVARILGRQKERVFLGRRFDDVISLPDLAVLPPREEISN